MYDIEGTSHIISGPLSTTFTSLSNAAKKPPKRSDLREHALFFHSSSLITLSASLARFQGALNGTSPLTPQAPQWKRDWISC